MGKEGLTGVLPCTVGYSGQNTSRTARFPCAAHAHVRSARLINQSAHTHAHTHKKKDYIKGGHGRRESGSGTRVGEIIPARMKAGEPPRGRRASRRSPHGGRKEEKKKKKKTSPQIKSVPAQVDIWSGSPDARRRNQTAKRSCRRAAGVIFRLFRGRLSSWLSAFR